MAKTTVLTPEMIEDVRRVLPTVMYLETVGDYLGVHRTTWRKWVKRGYREASRLARANALQPFESEAIYLEFYLAYRKGLAEAEIRDLGVIKKASEAESTPISKKTTTKKDGSVEEEVRFAAPEWTAAAWRQERRFPHRWGRRDRHELTGKDGKPIQTTVTVETAAQIDAQIERTLLEYRRETGQLANDTVTVEPISSEPADPPAAG